MAGRRDLSLRNDDCVADGAVLALGLAGFRAGRLDPCVNDLGMSLGGNLFLRFDNRSADRAADAIRQTRFGTGCGLAHNGLLSVAGRRNLSLRNDDLIADGAMFALGLTGLGAGRFDCRVNDLGVSLGRNDLLCNDDLVTDRAMFAFGLAGFGAGGFNCRVDDLGVSLRGYFLLCNDDLVTDRAMLALGLAGFGAGGLNCRVNDLGVSLRGYFLHAGESLAADRAFFAGFMTSLGAGCGLLGNFNGSMTGSSDCFCFGFVADRAGVGLDTGIFTGRSGRDLALIPLVSRCGNFLHAGESLAADRAFFAGFMTSLGAGSGLLGNFNGSMTGSIDCFGFGLVADRAGVGLDTGIFTSRSGRDLALIPTVSIRGNLSLRNDDCVADGAVFTLSLAGCGAGWLDCRVGDLGVSLGGNSRAGACFLAAIRTVGVAGVAWLGAGCFLGITKFCVLMCARRAAPYAFDIVDNIASLGSLRLGVGAVGVVQLSGGDGD